MFLKDYIEEYAEKKCRGDYKQADVELGKKFGVTARAVQSWRYLSRVPIVDTARFIVKATRGKVDYEGIYAPYKKISKR